MTCPRTLISTASCRSRAAHTSDVAILFANGCPNSAQARRTSAVVPAFIGDSTDCAIASKPPSCGRLRVLILPLSRNHARFALRGGESVSIILLYFRQALSTLARPTQG